MLSNKQKYSVATMLATNSLKSVLSRLKNLPEECQPNEAIDFAKKIDPLYKKRDGFVPQKVRELCK